MSFSSPKPPKVPDPVSPPPSLGDANVYSVGRFLKLQGRLGGIASTIGFGKTYKARTSEPSVVNAALNEAPLFKPSGPNVGPKGGNYVFRGGTFTSVKGTGGGKPRPLVPDVIVPPKPR